MERVSKLLSHLSTEKASSVDSASFASGSKSDSDIVIVNCIRTAICKARRGSFKDTTVQELLAPCLKYVAKDIDPSLIEDVVVGTVLAPGSMRHMECRQAGFLAGYPRTANMCTVNRQCSSGLQAIADVAAAIKSGIIEVGVAAGLESMSANSMRAKPPKVSDEVKQCEDALCCLMPMGITSENVASAFGITRKMQDECAVRSHQRAAAARLKFRDEILPIATRVKDKDTGKVTEIVVRDDDGVRGETTLAGLGKLRAAFKKGGTTTAGNSSQVSDGASAVLMMTRGKARSLGLKPQASLVHFTVAGLSPAIMGIGPALAIPKVLKEARLTTADVDLFEINEAFASQAVYCVEKLGLSWDKVNVNGGAIAFGHPLGNTGCRMVPTLLNELRRRGQKRGIVSMCIGTGMGAAAIFELEN